MAGGEGITVLKLSKSKGKDNLFELSGGSRNRNSTVFPLLSHVYFLPRLLAPARKTFVFPALPGTDYVKTHQLQNRRSEPPPPNIAYLLLAFIACGIQQEGCNWKQAVYFNMLNLSKREKRKQNHIK